MKPLLAVEVVATDTGVTVEDAYQYVEESVERLNASLGTPTVKVRLLKTGEELRQYEAGELVLYRKPTTRRMGDKIVYERNGERVELKQERLNL